MYMGEYSEKMMGLVAERNWGGRRGTIYEHFSSETNKIYLTDKAVGMVVIVGNRVLEEIEILYEDL